VAKLEESDKLHELNALLLRAEKAAQAMYANANIEDDDYFRSAEELEATVGQASQALKQRATEFMQEDNRLAIHMDELQDRVATLENAVKMVENVAGGIQAATQLIVSLRSIFGILI
jgi:hypothetical protein